MDSVRFGRALGIGARSAARALVTAVDAATAPNPNASKPASPTTPKAAARATPVAAAPQPPKPPAGQPMVQTAARAAIQVTHQARKTTQGVAKGSKSLGVSVWRPFVRLSGILLLEITGSFFVLFALFAGQAVWRHRTDLHQTALNPTAHLHLLFYCGLTLMFTYFAVSSFVRAHLRGRSH